MRLVMHLPRGESSMGTISWRRERTGPAGGVALRSPADGVAWRSLKGMKLYKN